MKLYESFSPTSIWGVDRIYFVCSGSSLPGKKIEIGVEYNLDGALRIIAVLEDCVTLAYMKFEPYHYVIEGGGYPDHLPSQELTPFSGITIKGERSVMIDKLLKLCRLFTALGLDTHRSKS